MINPIKLIVLIMATSGAAAAAQAENGQPLLLSYGDTCIGT